MERILHQVDPQFEPALGFQYRLSILLKQDGYSFLVCDTHTEKILLLSDYKNTATAYPSSKQGRWPANFSDYFNTLENIDLFKLSYLRTEIAIASDKITVAPARFLEGENAATVVSASLRKFTDESLIVGTILDNGASVAILLPQNIVAQCVAIFPGSIFKCVPAVFAKGLLAQNAQSDDRKIFIQIWESYFEVAVIQGARLLFLNAFNYAEPSDVLYYFIFILEQLGFVPSEEEITLMGYIDKNDLVYGLLKMYCGKLLLAQIPNGYKVSPGFSNIAWHKYFTLLNL